MPSLVLFFFGLAVGSFINVLALRYDGEHFVFDPRVIGGRSRCPHCKHTLRWFELVPIVSFVAQRGKCRKCSVRIGFRYPLIELLSGLIFLFIPFTLASYPWFISGFWILAFEILLLMAYIDLRLQIIPDELTIILGAVAIFEAIFGAAYLGPLGQSWASRLEGVLFGAAFFGFLILVTRGKGMGMGDVKLALPLGFLFGWPDIVLLSASAFVIGALVGVILIIKGRKTIKSAVPFAPFLVFGAAFIFFFGATATGWYFRIMGL